jgi:hypothetical protein
MSIGRKEAKNQEAQRRYEYKDREKRLAILEKYGKKPKSMEEEIRAWIELMMSCERKNGEEIDTPKRWPTRKKSTSKRRE